MRIKKHLDIQQKVDVDIVDVDMTLDDLTLIFNDYVEFDGNNDFDVRSQIGSVYQYLKSLPDEFIERMSDNYRAVTHKSLKEQADRFATNQGI